MPRFGNFVQSVYREESSSTANLIQALCAASSEFLPVVLDQEGWRGGRTYRYASIKSIRRSTQPALAKHGLWLNHVYSHTDQGLYCVTVLRHITGEYQTSTLPVPAREDAQERKAAMTLCCRTACEGLLAICTEEDDDGACCTDADAAQQAQWKSNQDLAAKAISEAASESDLERYLGMAQQRVKDGLMDPAAIPALKTLCELRSMTLKTKETKSADGKRTAGTQGSHAARGGSGASDQQQPGAAGTGRGGVRAGDRSDAVPA